MSKKMYKDLISTSGAYMVVSIVGVLSGILFPRLLGPEEWGLWSITLGLLGILGPFAQMAMSTTLVNYISKYRRDREKVNRYTKSAYMIALTSSFIISICIITLSGHLAETVFDDGRLVNFFYLGSTIIFFDQLNIVNRDYFRGYKDFRRYNVLKVVSAISVFFVVLLFFVLFSYRAIYVAIGHVTVFSAVCIAVFIFLFKYDSNFNITKGFEKKETIQILKFGVPLIFTMAFITTMKSIDRILIGYFLEASDVGIYSVASGIPWMIGSMMAPVSIVLLPTLSERKAEGRSSDKLLREVFSFLIYTSIPLIVFIMFFSEDILWILFGGDFTLGSVVLSIASLEILFFGGYVIFRTSVQAAEKTGMEALSIGVAAGVNILANLILIPSIGIEGAAIGTLISFVILFILIIYLVKKNYHVDLKSVKLHEVLPFTIIITSLTYVIYIQHWGMLSFMIAVISMVSFSLFFMHLIKPLWYEELLIYLRNMF